VRDDQGASAQLAAALTVKSGSTCSVDIAGNPTTVQVARDLTVAVGDVLVMVKTGNAGRSQWFAVARAYAAAPTVDPSMTPGPPAYTATVSGLLTVSPTFTGTYRDGSWVTGTDQPSQGVYGGYGNAVGVAYYGSKPTALAGATVTDASVTVQRVAGGTASAQTATLARITESAYDGGAPTVGATAAGPVLAVGADVSFTVPTAWAQAFVDGTAGGLGVYDADGSPFMRFAGRGSGPAAWFLSIEWSR